MALADSHASIPSMITGPGREASLADTGALHRADKDKIGKAKVESNKMVMPRRVH